MRSALLLAIAATLALSGAPRALAQPGEDVAVARRLFTEGLKDEQNKRFDVALDKFRQVQRVRDTVNVRYRIGTCLEGMGRVAAAIKAYQSAIDLGAGDKGNADVVKASTERIAALDRQVARVTLTLSDRAPADAEVRVDDEKVEREALGQPILLDPGHHTISAKATGAQDFHTSMTLAEGGNVSLSIPLDPVPPGATQGAGTPGVAATAGTPGGAATPPPDETPQASPPGDHHVLGYALLAGGGVLVIGSIVTFVVRHNAISSLGSSCGPTYHCPAGADDQSLSSTASRARFEGPLGVALGAAGLVALGAGAYFVAFSPRAPRSAALGFTPVISSRAASLAVEGVF
jgi:hypothetical protein